MMRRRCCCRRECIGREVEGMYNMVDEVWAASVDVVAYSVSSWITTRSAAS